MNKSNDVNWLGWVVGTSFLGLLSGRSIMLRGVFLAAVKNSVAVWVTLFISFWIEFIFL